jgi:hypothetical protein
MQHDFRFWETRPETVLSPENGASQAFWYPVRRIFDETNPMTAVKLLMEAGLGAAETGAVDRLGRLYEVVHNEKVIVFFRDEEQDIDRVLDIFVRVNSAGMPLSQSDLLLSIMTAHFVERDARAAVLSLVDELNKIGQGFSFNKDLVLKAGLALVEVPDFSFKIKNFGRENTLLRDKHWDEIANILRLARGLFADFGFGTDTLAASSVLIPVAYYLHHRGVDQNYRTSGAHDDDRRALRLWVNRTLIKPGIWGSGLDTMLRDLRSAIRNHGDEGFPVEAIEEALRPRGKSTEFSAGEVVDLLSTSYTQKGCFALLATLFPHVDTRNKFHVDHVFPQKLFTRKELSAAGLPNEIVDETIEGRHRLANLQLLEGPVNVEKQAEMPARWARQRYADGYSDYLARNDLPEIPETFDGFRAFYLERKRRLARRLAGVLGVDPGVTEALVTPDEDETLAASVIEE